MRVTHTTSAMEVQRTNHTMRVPCSTLPLTLYYYCFNGVSDKNGAFFIKNTDPVYLFLIKYTNMDTL